MPLPRDYQKANRLLRKLQSMEFGRTNTRSLGQTSGSGMWNDLYNIVANQASTWKKSRILNALPSNATQIKPVLQSGGTSQVDYNRSIVELSWLEAHGQCMDNIKVGQSKNPDSGRGAFANRFILEGGLVAPAPLIHVPDYQVLKMFPPKVSEQDSGKVDPNREGPFTFQLMMNYCFGHSHSTLVLCPYGMLTAYINHSRDEPNTKLQWSKEMQHPEWREWPVDEWGRDLHAGLSFDFVALRDIQEDEEILIDYGEVWEQSWQEHVRTFVPRENYVPASELNEMMDFTYRTMEDRDYQSDGVQLWCRARYVSKPRKGWNLKDQECRILKKLGEQDRFIVQIINTEHKKSLTNVVPGKIVFDVPSAAFYFTDMQDSRDHLQFDAFRHPMMIPDEVFPEAWKMKKRNAAK
jgi:hypothetical protein